jgi:stage V sporulation protein SpoVS
VGAGAGNNVDKALIIARGEAFKNGDILACVPAFADVEFEGVKKTGIVKGIINIRELY